MTDQLEEHKWKPGQSGNPAGRPIGSRNRSTIIKEWLEWNVQDGKTHLDMVIEALLDKAKAGDVPAIKELLDSSFGKNPDVIAGDPNNPLNNSLAVTFVGKKDD